MKNLLPVILLGVAALIAIANGIASANNLFKRCAWLAPILYGIAGILLNSAVTTANEWSWRSPKFYAPTLLILAATLVWTTNIISKARNSAVSTQLREQSPVVVRMRELYRTPKDNYSQSAFDLFLKVRLESSLLTKARIKGSRFELLLHGVTEGMEAIHDLVEWEIGEWESKFEGATINSYPLMPLPEQLCANEPVEGWLHFQTKPTTGEMLEKCSIRLIVRTDSGSGYHERDADPLIWNPRKITISRRVGGQLWNP